MQVFLKEKSFIALGISWLLRLWIATEALPPPQTRGIEFNPSHPQEQAAIIHLTVSKSIDTKFVSWLSFSSFPQFYLHFWVSIDSLCELLDLHRISVYFSLIQEHLSILTYQSPLPQAFSFPE